MIDPNTPKTTTTRDANVFSRECVKRLTRRASAFVRASRRRRRRTPPTPPLRTPRRRQRETLPLDFFVSFFSLERKRTPSRVFFPFQLAWIVAAAFCAASTPPARRRRRRLRRLRRRLRGVFFERFKRHAQTHEAPEASPPFEKSLKSLSMTPCAAMCETMFLTYTPALAARFCALGASAHVF